MKHSHRGRVLTTTATTKSEKIARRSTELLATSALPPITSQQSAVISSLQYTGATASTADARIIALEKENLKLRERLTEADRSITNYRSLLNPGSGGAIKHTVSTQTSTTSPQMTSIENDTPEKRIEKLEKVNVQLTRRIEDLNKTLDDGNVAIKRLSADNTMLIEQIEKNNERSSQKNEQAADIDTTYDMKIRISASASLLRGTADQLRADLLELRAASEDWMVEAYANVDTMKLAVSKIPSLMRLPTPPAIPDVYDSATSPMKGDRGVHHTSSIGTSPVRWSASMPPNPDEAEDQKKCLNEKGQLLPELTYLSEPVSEASTPVKCGTVADTTAPADAGSIDTGATINPDKLIENVRNYIDEVAKAYRLEINAVKHTAHCKDLSRLAAQRELALERDRALIELKHARYGSLSRQITININIIII